MPDLAAFHFPLEPFDALLASLGWPDRERWLQAWQQRGGDRLAAEAWHRTPSSEWIWGLALPLLTQIETLARAPQRSLLGLSAIPATGKTTLCRWLKAAAQQIGIQIDAISIDDFYRASPDLEASMRGNPWGVARGLPGSHEIDRMLQCIADWREGRPVSVPIFDKTLRGGRGDRAGFRPLQGRVLLLDGWFLGVPAERSGEQGRQRQAADARQIPTLRAAERLYRPIVLERLKAYEPLWRELDLLWRIRPVDLAATAVWKQQQTSFTLPPAQADQFIRMILCSIPVGLWERIPRTVEALIDQHRAILHIARIPPGQPSA